MNYAAVRWVLDDTKPATGPEKLVLVALAGDANKEWRAWPAIERLAEMACQSARSVQRHLHSLEVQGYLAIYSRYAANGGRSSNEYELLGPSSAPTPPQPRSPRATRGVNRDTRMDDKLRNRGVPPCQCGCHQGSATTLASGGDTTLAPGGDTTMSPEVVNEVVKRSSLTYPRAPRGGWTSTNSVSDLADVGVETLGDTKDRSTVDELDQRRRRRHGPPTNPYALAQHFNQRAGLVFRGFAVGNTNQGALAKSFSTWLREGVSPWQIRTMIDVFMERGATCGPGKPPWKIFLGQREALFTFIADRTDPDTVIATPEVYTWLKSQ